MNIDQRSACSALKMTNTDNEGHKVVIIWCKNLEYKANIFLLFVLREIFQKN